MKWRWLIAENVKTGGNEKRGKEKAKAAQAAASKQSEASLRKSALLAASKKEMWRNKAKPAAHNENSAMLAKKHGVLAKIPK
jgi:hypothetical protein